MNCPKQSSSKLQFVNEEEWDFLNGEPFLTT